MKYPRMDWGTMEAVVNKLGGMEGVERFLKNELVLRPTFPLYLGEVGGKSRDELLAEITEAGMYTDNWATSIMSRPAWTPGERETVRFGRATIKELGFTHEPTWKEMLERIEELGHERCRPQDGPAIRLALADQPKNDGFFVAMDLITGSDGNSRAFYVLWNSDGGRWLRGGLITPASRLFHGASVVFRL